MSIVSYAQNFEDVMLWRALGHIEQGRYLDVGAQDPIVDSVSFAFYKAGWRGVHIEPTPFYASRLREARPDETVIEAAVTDATGPVTLYEIPDTGMSTGDEKVAADHRKAGFESHPLVVPSIRLDELLGMAKGDIHWMKIDVEGMEADVLRSWGRSAIRPWVLVIEAIYPTSHKPTHQQWIEEVLRRDYREVHFDGLSRFFVHQAHEALATRFGSPPNVFDEFAVSPIHWTAREVDRTSQIRLETASAKASQRETELRQAMEHALVQAAAAVEDAKAATVERDQAWDDAIGARAQLDVASHRHDAALMSMTIASERLQSEASSATARLWEAEREHREALVQQWRDRQAVEANFRAEVRDRGDKLQAVLCDATTSAATAQIDLIKVHSAEIAQRADLVEVTRSIDNQMHDLRTAQLKLQKILISRQRRQPISVGDILSRRGTDFIDACYVHLLSRTPEDAGMTFHLNLLRNGVSRTSIFINIYRSAKITGLEPQIQGIGFLLFRDFIHKFFLNMFASIKLGLRNLLPEPRPRLIATTTIPVLTINLKELLALDHFEFLYACYRRILGREPDPSGLASYLAHLNAGIAKSRVIGYLAYSSEGKCLNIHIRSLWWRYALAGIFSK